MKTLTRLLIAPCIILMLTGCGGSDSQRAIPRRTAYPRPQLPDTVLATYEKAPLHFEINADANTVMPRKGWLDISYPMLGATVHVTFTETTAENIDEIRRNRMERLMLNSGDRPSTHSEFTNPSGFDVLIAETDGATTPLQFLATDSRRWVVSGAVYFNDPDAGASYDSIHPMVDALRRDITKAMTALSEK